MDKANVPSDPSAIKQPYVAVLTSPTFDCSECIDDARVRTWAAAEVPKTLKLRPAAQQVTGAKLNELEGCVATGTVTAFRARPIWRALRDVYNVTFADCLKRSSP
jgi:hypothetical protein